MAQNDATQTDSLMDTLEALAGEGRIPVEDLTARDDPRLHLKTPEGVIKTSRTPDSVNRKGSATQRRWTWGSYRLEEESDGNPDVENNLAVVVTKKE